MSVPVANINLNLDTFNALGIKINEIADIVSNQVITANTANTGANTLGNINLIGQFRANTVIGETFRGGTLTSPGEATFSSNVAFSNNVNLNANVFANNLTTSISSNVISLNATSFSISSITTNIANTISIANSKVNFLTSISSNIIPANTLLYLGNTSLKWHGFFGNVVCDTLTANNVDIQNLSASALTFDSNTVFTGSVFTFEATTFNISNTANLVNIQSTNFVSSNRTTTFTSNTLTFNANTNIFNGNTTLINSPTVFANSATFNGTLISNGVSTFQKTTTFSANVTVNTALMLISGGVLNVNSSISSNVIPTNTSFFLGNTSIRWNGYFGNVNISALTAAAIVSDNIRTTANNYYFHTGNMGAGSGLDADRLDNLDSSYFTNATNMVAGTLNISRLPIANSVEAANSAVSNKLLTPASIGGIAGSDRLLTSTGYSSLPGGLYIQWGQDAVDDVVTNDYTVYFPKVFPNECFQFIPSILYHAGTSRIILDEFHNTDTATITFSGNANTLIGTTFSWMAIGY